MANFSLATTEDGSLSLHENNLNELYHNRAGAYSEALTNYVEPTMQFLKFARENGSPLSVLDSCFGLGYNSLALANTLISDGQYSLAVDAIEIDQDVLDVVPQVMKQDCFAPLRQRTLKELNFDVSVCDLRQFLLARKASNNKLYDVIYHDPFSPKKVPELWTVDLFSHYFHFMAEDSVLLTYACAPAVRGALISLGFHVFRTSGLGRKNGGTIAIKSHNKKLVEALLQAENSTIFAIEGEELRRLGKSSQVPFRDVTLSDNSETILARREIEQAQFRQLNQAEKLDNTSAQ